jgi:HlyD family secretion protein
MRLVFALPAALLAVLTGCGLPEGDGTYYSGTIEAVEVDVVPDVSGRILTRPVDEGSVVAAGDVVATIDPEPYRNALRETEAALSEAGARLDLLAAGYRREEVTAAEREVDEATAQVALARAQLERVEALVKNRIATEEDRDRARRDVDVAKARLAAAGARLDLLARGYRKEEVAQARAEVARLEALLAQRRLDLDRTTVLSPLTGTVTEKILEAGEYARAGSPIVSVADLENLYTWVYLSEVDLPRVRIGDAVSVRIDGAPDRSFPGKVSYISPQAEFTPRNVQTREDRVQLVFGVKVSVPNPDGILKVGIPADVVLPAGAP